MSLINERFLPVLFALVATDKHFRAGIARVNITLHNKRTETKFLGPALLRQIKSLLMTEIGLGNLHFRVRLV